MDAKRKLFIIGASSFGRVMESWLEMIPEENRDWKLEGFLHTFQGESPLAGYPSGYDILGAWEDYPLTKDDYCIIALADSNWKEKIYRYLMHKTTFYTYIAPGVIIGKCSSIGLGCIICPNCVISTNVHLGTCVTINQGTQLSHDVTIGDFSSVMGNVDLTGKVIVGKKVFIGVGATIIPEMHIEDGSKVGAGSVVVKNVTKGDTVFGNPARVIGSKK